MNSLPATASAIEKALIDGDLSALSPEHRVIYYKQTCDSLGLNYLTQPFKYIRLNNKLTLYATKDCTDQIRATQGVSITDLIESTIAGVFFVKAKGHNREGRADVSTGAVAIAGLGGEELANAMMKAETKAKRRLTLSLCGLGMLDESEVRDIRGSKVVLEAVNVTTGEDVKGIALEAPPESSQAVRNIEKVFGGTRAGDKPGHNPGAIIGDSEIELFNTGQEVPKNYWLAKDRNIIGGENFGTRKINGKWMIVEKRHKRIEPPVVMSGDNGAPSIMEEPPPFPDDDIPF